ncbi:Nuclear pore-associated protein 1 [Plecturocebus cupreus]
MEERHIRFRITGIQLIIYFTDFFPGLDAGPRDPSPGCKVTLPLPSPPEQVPARLPKEIEGRAEQEPRTVMQEHHVETQGQDDKKRAPGSVICIQGLGDPGRPHLLRVQAQASAGKCPLLVVGKPRYLGRKAQVSPVSGSFWEDHDVPSSHSPSGGGLSLEKSDPAPAVLPDLAGGCSLLLEKQPWRLADVGEGDAGQEAFSSFIMELFSVQSCQQQAGKKENVDFTTATTGPILWLMWDRGELLPPAKLPCLSVEGYLGNLENSMGRKWRLWRTKIEAKTNCHTTQPALAVSPPAETSDSLSLATYASQVPAPLSILDLAELPDTPSCLSVHLTPHQKYPKTLTTHYLYPLTLSLYWAPSTSDLPISSGPTPFSFQPPFRRETPICVCVHSPPPFLSHRSSRPFHRISVITKQMNSTVVISTITANTSVHQTLQPLSDHQAISRGTTFPPKAVIFKTSSGFRMRSLPFLQVDGSAQQGPPVSHENNGNFQSHCKSRNHCSAHIQGPQWAAGKAGIPHTPVILSHPIMTPPDISSLGSPTTKTSSSIPTIDSSAVDTIPNSKAVIFQSAII